VKKLENEMNRGFSKEEGLMAQTTHGEMLTILGHKGNEKQNTSRFFLTPVRMVSLKNTKTKNGDDVGKGTLILC
jgi:hypothetical protein